MKKIIYNSASILVLLFLIFFLTNATIFKKIDIDSDEGYEKNDIENNQKKTEHEAEGEGEEKENPAYVKLSVQETADLWEKYESTLKNSQVDNASDPWISMGPKGAFNRLTQVPGSKFSGKILDIEITNQGYFRIGSANGGLWEQLFIGEPVCLTDNITSQKIGAFASNFLNPDEIYVGTGEIGGGRDGTGIFKTTNKGVNWVNILPANNSLYLAAVSKVLYNPLYPEIVHISGAGQLNNYLRTTNGGTNWRAINIGGMTTISDLVINPLDPTILYAAVWGSNAATNIFKTTNSGSTWNAMASTSGLPTANFGNTTLAICNDQPNILYALIANSTNNNLLGVYKTINGGTNWNRLNTPTEFDILNGQGFHANSITVSPRDPNKVLAGGVYLIRSSDGGTNWTAITSPSIQPGTVNPNVHADIQSFEWNENGTTLYLANDGGLAVSSDAGVTYNTNINSFPITETVYFDYSEGNNNYLASGVEHNGTVVTSNGGATWNHTQYGDGSGAAIHPTDQNLYYSTVGVVPNNPVPFYPSFSTNSGLTWTGVTNNITGGCGQWYNQIKSSRTPNNFQIFVPICKGMWRSTNNGANWLNLNMPMTATGYLDYGFDVMPLTNQLFVPTTDSTTSNTGKLYTGISQAWFDISPNIGNKVIQKVKAAFLLLAIVRGSIDSTNKIYKMSADRVLNPEWTKVPSNGISQYPLTDIQLDYSDTNRMIVGTQGWGCFITTNGGQNWYPWNEGLPKGMIIQEMKLIDSAQGEDYVLISTYGRGIFKRKLNAKVISVSDPVEILKQYELNQNYPNPFNPVTTIKFNIPKKEYVKLSVYDINGREVSTLVDRVTHSGIYTASFNGADFPSGVYFYKLTTPSFTQTKKMILVK
ncbi:MAG: T9SS type A sorting domain-containing protein [Bacteroidetes bacterium]|nr:T9SS type A sorting domain-containing protein [Bacteroidota bacterium]